VADCKVYGMAPYEPTLNLCHPCLEHSGGFSSDGEALQSVGEHTCLIPCSMIELMNIQNPV